MTTHQAHCYLCQQPRPDARTRYELSAFLLCDECARQGTPTGTPHAPPKHSGRDRYHAVIWAVSVALKHNYPAKDVLALAVDHDRAANHPPIGHTAVEAIVVTGLRKLLEVAS